LRTSRVLASPPLQPDADDEAGLPSPAKDRID
jgi:hypothetical protein